MEPKLALVYNSNSGNGIIGKGWSLSGLSYIVRDPAYGINYDGNDHFKHSNLGQLVKLESGTGNIYHSRDESFWNLEAIGQCKDGPCYWKGTDKSGNKYYYGGTSETDYNGRIYDLNYNGVEIWALSKVEDIFGNFYTIKHYRTNSSIYAGGHGWYIYDYGPYLIEYTRNDAGNEEIHSIEFEYEKREDKMLVEPFRRMQLISIKRIQKIIVKSHGTIVREYPLDYDYSTLTGESRLKSLKECSYNSDGLLLCLPNNYIDFTWAEPGANQFVDIITRSIVPFRIMQPVTSSEFGVQGDASYTKIADFNGDGLNDILQYHVPKNNNKWNLYLNSGNGNMSFQYQTPFGNVINSSYTKIGDFNGDGKADIMQAEYNAATGKYDKVIYFSNGKLIGGEFFTRVLSEAGAGLEVGGAQIADFNGDGMDDYLVHFVEINLLPYIKVKESDGTGKFNQIYCEIYSVYNNPDFLKIGDFNGDGKADLLLYNTISYPNKWSLFVFKKPTYLKDQGMHVTETINVWTIIRWVSLGNTSDCFSYKGSTSFGINVDGSFTKVADFNGDGKMDILQYHVPLNNNKWNLFLSYGLGNFEFWGSTSFGVTGNSSYTKIADFNGDGKADILQYNTSAFPYWWDLYITVLNSEEKLFKKLATTPFSGQSDASYTKIADFDGDKKADILQYHQPDGNYKWNLYKLQSSSIHDSIVSIGNFSGNKLEIQYAKNTYWLYNFNELFNPIWPEKSVYPIITGNFSQNLVRTVTAFDGRGNEYSTKYNYHNRKIYNGLLPDRKDMGFEYVIKENWQTRSKEKTYYHYSGTNEEFIQKFSGRVNRQEVYDANITSSPGWIYGKLIKAGSIEYELNLVDEYKTEYVRLKKRTESFYEAGTFLYSKSQEIKSYDNNGNPTKIEDSAGDTETITTTITYHPVSDGIQNRPKEIVKETATGARLQEEKFFFNTGCGANSLCEKQVWLDKGYQGVINRYLSMKYTYDSYGNITTIIDPKTHKTEFEYEKDFHNYPNIVRNHLGHTVSLAFDAKFGVLSEETDFNGNTKKYLYDEFGRLKEVQEQRGTDFIPVQIFSYDENIGNAHAQNIQTQTRQTDPGSTATLYQFSKKYFDNMGRIHREAFTGPPDPNAGQGASGYAIISYDFDYDGRLGRKSNPFLLDSNGTQLSDPQYTTYSYDDAGRLQTVEFPEPDTKSSYAYNTEIIPGKTSVSVTDPLGKITTKIFDARGRIKTIKEPGNSQLDYEYNEANGQITITNKNNRQTIIKFDSLGRKISLTEPNTGTWNYAYDDAGNLETQVDPKGQITTFFYDELNRITKKDLPGASDIDVVYSYDNTAIANSKGRLTSVFDTSGTTEFSYDIYGNVTSWIKRTEERVFSFSAEFDIQNRLTDLTYPDGTEIRNFYSTTGHLQNVRLIKNAGSPVEAGFGAELVTYSGPTVSGTAFEVKRRTGNNITTAVKIDTATFRPINIRTILKGGTSDLENYTFGYDAAGNVKQILDNLDSGKSQYFDYDDLYRLKSARSDSLYGTINYDYSAENSAEGNQTQKGSLYLKYNDTVHPHAVSQADSPDGTPKYNFTYDTSGNMSKRKNRDLVFDSEDRLAAVKNGGVNVQSYIYDYNGQRVIKKRNDGSKVYNISGLYEVAVKSNQTEIHTKYIYGIEGELVAQITKENYTLAAIETQNKRVLASLYAVTSAKGLALGIYHKVDYFLARPENIIKSLWILFYITAFIILAFHIYYNLFRRDLNPAFQRLNPAIAHLVPVVLILFMFQFGFYGCGVDKDADPSPYWTQPAPNSGPDISELSGDYNDNTLQGFPVEGTYFFHPNHLRSISMVSDAVGKIITRIFYKPYGEILRKDSNDNPISKGPDIFRFKFTGQEEDTETGLLYFNARYYDPEIGRFISPDTMVPNPENSQSFNRYMYARGNPLRFIDPTGNSDDGAYESGGYYDYYSIQLFSMFNSIDFYSMPMMGNDFAIPGFGALGGLDALNTISSGMSWFSALSMMDSGTSMESLNSFSMNYGSYASTSLAYDSSYSSFGNDYSYGTGGCAGFVECNGWWIPGLYAIDSFNNGEYGRAGISLAMIALPFAIGKIVTNGTKSIFTYIPSAGKKFNQITRRGWTNQMIHESVNSPFTTRQAINKGTGNPATAFFNKDGSYIVRDNISGQLIQLSDKTGHWIPDSSIINPYIPRY